MFKKMFPLLGTAGLLTVTALCASPVKAEPQDSQVLLSQLRGHETYLKEPQMDPTQYVVGRVRGAVGGILSVELMNLVTTDGKTLTYADPPTGSVRIVGDAAPGDDVIFQVVDDQLVYVGKAHPYWISRLKLKSETASAGTTSQLIEELNRSETSTGLPPLAPETRTFTAEPIPAPAPAAAPIRGLW